MILEEYVFQHSVTEAKLGKLKPHPLLAIPKRRSSRSDF